MSHHEDRAKVLAAFGGKKGLIDSGIPSVIILTIASKEVGEDGLGFRACCSQKVCP